MLQRARSCRPTGVLRAVVPPCGAQFRFGLFPVTFVTVFAFFRVRFAHAGADTSGGHAALRFSIDRIRVDARRRHQRRYYSVRPVEGARTS